MALVIDRIYIKTSKVFSTNLTTNQPHIQSNKDPFKRSNFQTTPQQSLRLDCKPQIVGLQQFIFSKKIFAMIQISLDHPIKLFLTIHPPKKLTFKNSSKIQKTSRVFWMFFWGPHLPRWFVFWGWAMISPLYRDVKIWRKLRQTCRSPGVHLVWRFPRVDRFPHSTGHPSHSIHVWYIYLHLP